MNIAVFVLLIASVPALAVEMETSSNLADDIRILDRASELLSDESRWNRRDNRKCLPHAQTFSLFCSLRAASIEVLGRYQHRRVALEEVRSVIEERSNGRNFEHRLMDFNNLPTTTIQDVRDVLALARAKIAAQLRVAESPR